MVDPWNPGEDGWTPFEAVPQIPSTFVYLRNDSTGRHVGAEPDGAHIRMHEHTGDDCMWLLKEASEGRLVLRSAVTDLVLQCCKVAPIAPSYGERGVAFRIDGVEELFPAEAENMRVRMGQRTTVQEPADEIGRGVFTALCGPNRLPSDYVAEMEATGYAILDNIYRPDDIKEIKAMHSLVLSLNCLSWYSL